MTNGRATAPAGNGLHHGRLDLEEPPRVQELAQGAHQTAPERKDLAHLGVDHEIDVAAPVAGLHVAQAVPLLGERAQGLGQKAEDLDGHGELTRPRAEGLAGHADEVPDVEGAEERKVVAKLVGPGVELDPPGMVHQLGEARLAVVSLGDDAPGQAHRTERLQLVLAGGGQGLGQRPCPVGHGIASPEGVHPAIAEGLQLRVPLLDLLVLGKLAHARPFDHRRYALIRSSRSPSMTPSTLPTSSPVRWSLTSWYGWKVYDRI